MISRKAFLVILIALFILASVVVLVFVNQKGWEEEQDLTDGTSIPVEEGSLKGKTLTPDKEAIKNRLVAPVGDAGVLAETSEFRIEYYSPDVFQVEIKVTNIADARDEAITWFKDKGFSEDDICKLPVTFYLNPEVVRKLEGSGVTFNTLPDFCR